MAMRKFCGKGIVVYLGCDSGSMNLQTHTHTGACKTGEI